MANRANPLQTAYQSFEQAAAKANPDFNAAGRQQLLHIFYVSIIGVVAIIFAIIPYTILYLQTGAWQFLGVIGLIAVATIVTVIGFILATKGHLNKAGNLILIALAIVYGGFPFFWANVYLYAAVGGLLLILLTASLVLPKQWPIWVGHVLLFAVILGASNFWRPFARYDINQSPFLQNFFAIITILIALVMLGQGLRALKFSTIRTRLLVSFVSITLLPLIIIGAFSSITSSQNIETQVLAQLNSVATLKEAEIDAWLSSLQSDIAITITGIDMKEVFESLLTQETSGEENESALAADLRGRFRETINKAQQFEELFLISKEGQILLSTDALREGEFVNNEPFFQEASSGINYTQPPAFFPSTGRTVIFVARPLFNVQGRVMGMVVGQASLLRLNDILFERAGLGRTGETYLIGENHVLLTGSRFDGFPIGATSVRTEAADAILESRINGSGSYESYHGDLVFGVYRWIRGLDVGLLAEQSRTEALRASQTAAQLALGATIVAAIAAVAASYLITRSIANPLGNLTNTATQIAAGNLTLSAPVQQQDEIGTLAVAFNSMTAQIRELVNTLEQRILDRTQALATSVEVSRQLSTILDQSELAAEVVNQVQTAFNYYHTHIYLFDEKDEHLIMAAGTGEAGEQMLRNKHMIPKGKGLVGRAAAINSPILVPDVSQEAGWLANPLLPETKAEAAVPIAFGREVLGVLDVQHNQINGLQDADVDLLQSIANQVAIALRNARLYQELEAQARHAALINEINKKILNTTDSEDAMQVAIREVGRALNAPYTRVRLTAVETEPNKNGRSLDPTRS